MIVAHPPAKITFTGLDAKTDIGRVNEISREFFGKVEWGVLVSQRNSGIRSRYPSFEHVHAMADKIDVAGDLAVHVCGHYARMIAGEGVVAPELLALLYEALPDRVQVNTNDGELNLTDVTVDDIIRNLVSLHKLTAAVPILQCAGPFPKTDAKIDFLFDKSGGTGVGPDSWPMNAKDVEQRCGYAGGIGPVTLERYLMRISSSHGTPDVAYWIDMETGVRTTDADGHDWLDLDKCEDILRRVYR